MTKTNANCMAAANEGIRRCWTFQTWFCKDKGVATSTLKGSADFEDRSGTVVIEVLLRDGEPLLAEVQLMSIVAKLPKECGEIVRVQLQDSLKASIPGPHFALPPAVEHLLEPEVLDRLFEMTSYITPNRRATQLAVKLRELDEILDRVAAR
jgi:hypothetical protein